jgi:hypothetical protein
MTLVCLQQGEEQAGVFDRAYPRVLTLRMIRSPSQWSGTSCASLDHPLLVSLIAPGRGAVPAGGPSSAL